MPCLRNEYVTRTFSVRCVFVQHVALKVIRRKDHFARKLPIFTEHFDLATSLKTVQSCARKQGSNHVYMRSVCATLPFFEFRIFFHNSLYIYMNDNGIRPCGPKVRILDLEASEPGSFHADDGFGCRFDCFCD